MLNWQEYINQTKNKRPRELLLKALGFINNKDNALDLGAGALNESKYLLDFGFKRVIAIDIEQNSEIIRDINSDSFVFIQSKIEDYSFPQNEFDLINAQFVLPFIKQVELNNVIDKINLSLKDGGIFVGQFFGLNDSWAEKDNVSCYSCDNIKKLLSVFETIFIDEEEKDGQTAEKINKHWHIINFIVKKSKI